MKDSSEDKAVADAVADAAVADAVADGMADGVAGIWWVLSSCRLVVVVGGGWRGSLSCVFRRSGPKLNSK